MDYALASNGIVFLLDDKSGFWFDAVGTAIQAAGWQCGETERFNDGNLKGELRGSAIYQTIFDLICARLQLDETAEFAVISDSQYGQDDDAGARLLHALHTDLRLSKRFRYGVVYSSRPLGDTIPGLIERLEQRASSLNADASMIVDFLRTGELGSARQIVTLIERLSFFEWLKDSEVFSHRMARCRQSFRPVLTYGCPDTRFQGECFCDPILEGIGQGIEQLFTARSSRWFEPTVYACFGKYFDPVNDAELLNSCVMTLCPLASLEAAADSKPKACEFAAGSLRLLWDATMCGNDPTRLSQDYYESLKNVTLYPSEFEDKWCSYIGMFNDFANHSNPEAVFASLWDAALREVQNLEAVAKLVKERGLK